MSGDMLPPKSPQKAFGKRTWDAEGILNGEVTFAQTQHTLRLKEALEGNGTEAVGGLLGLDKSAHKKKECWVLELARKHCLSTSTGSTDANNREECAKTIS